MDAPVSGSSGRVHRSGAVTKPRTVPANWACRPKKRRAPRSRQSCPGAPHHGGPGDGIALQPARSLLDPGPESGIRLLEGCGVQQFRPVAMALQADAQFRVLGDVMGVPGAHPDQRVAFDEQRRPSERHDQPQTRNAGQKHPEPAGVFDGKATADPVVIGVVVIQLTLQAGDLGRGQGKPRGHAVELIGLRVVFGVVDADDRAAGKGQRIVQRPRLGLRLPPWHHQRACPGRQVAGRDGLGGFRVAGLEA